MAQIDPSIILSAVQQQRAGTSPFSNLQNIIQFQDLMEKRKLREASQQKERTIQGLIGQNISQTPEGISLNQPTFIQQLAQIDPQAALEQQAIVTKQAAEQQKLQAQKKKAEADEKIAIAKASKAELEKARDLQDMIGSTVGAVLAANPEDQQAVLDDGLDRLIDSGVITEEMLQSGKIPLTVTPDNLALMQGIQQSALTSKEQLDFALKSRETPEKETAAKKSERVRQEEQQDFRAQIDNRFVDKLKKGRNLNKKTVEDLQRFQTSAPTILSQVNDLQRLISKSSLQELKNATSDASAEVASTLGSLQFNVKELFDLGALQQPDLELIDRLTGDPSQFNLSNLRKQSTAKRLGVMAKNIVRLFNNKIGSIGISRFSKNEILGMGADSMQFNSVEDAEKANLPKGTHVIIDGREAVVE